ncbi:hypothetical protein VNO80_19001 [Phaseolus coccineus]|uniref:Uncharacterized protein n=1 Tax=Phaseolus coccineus TaxID=3886 RepID=A0AAN9MFD2_PHACN
MSDFSFFFTNFPPERDFQKKEQVPWKRPIALRKAWNQKVQNQFVDAAKAKSRNASFAQVVKGGGVRASQEDAVLGSDTPSFTVKAKISFEEESYAEVTMVGCSHGRWGGASKGDSKARVDDSVRDDFYVSDGSDVGGNGSAKGKEEASVHFPVAMGGSPRDDACMGAFRRINHSDNIINYSLGINEGAWERNELNTTVIKELPKVQEGSIGDASFNNNHFIKGNLSDNKINYFLGIQENAWERKELGAVTFKEPSKGQEGPFGDAIISTGVWPEELSCVGSTLAHSHEDSWVRDSLDLGPIPNLAKLVGHPIRVSFIDSGEGGGNLTVEEGEVEGLVHGGVIIPDTLLQPSPPLATLLSGGTGSDLDGGSGRGNYGGNEVHSGRGGLLEMGRVMGGGSMIRCDREFALVNCQVLLGIKKLGSNVGLAGLNLKPFRSKIITSSVGRDEQITSLVDLR